MVHSPVSSLYYCKVGKTIKQGLCRLENDADVQEFLKTGDYDFLDSSDAYCSSDDKHVIDYVDFYHEGEQGVVVKNITTNDPFLTKLCSNNGNFRGFINEHILVNKDLHIEDPESSSFEPTHQIQRGVAYPRHDPLQPWNEMQPILDIRQLLVYCGRDVPTGRCVRQAILDTNPGSTCILDDEETEYGNSYFRRFYICFKGVKDGWKAGCRRVIGLDGCFLKHTCRGELLTTIGRDANNQMYPIAWAVVKVENFENWSWFISLLAEDLELGHGTGITVISDSHKGLLDAVSDWFPNAEHRKCTRHVFANFKKKFSGMNKKAMNLEDRITPSIRKRLEILKEQQRLWTVIPSGFQELEVRQGDQSFGVNLHLKKCMCKLWELSGIPCIHSVASYLFLNKVPDEGVDHWYSQDRWFEAYQFSIKPIYGSNMWKKQSNKPLLPPIVVRMPGRPKKNRVKAKSENNSQVSRVGKQITYSKCYEKGHNRRNCDKEQLSKSPQMKNYASNKGGGRGSRGGRGQATGGMGEASGGRGQASGALGEASSALGEASGGRGQSNAARFQATTERGESSGGRGRARGRGGKGRGRGGRGRGRGVTTMLVDEEYMEQILIEEEEKRIAAEKAIQEEFNEEAVRLTLEEEARYEKENQEKNKR
ncbi:pentatricopeptide repeat-containing protein [Tanacetum coccineum]